MFYITINAYNIYAAIVGTSAFCLTINACLELINLSTLRTNYLKRADIS